jgi:BirA family biotin operon repressor/biotin-[acetyl-CoA-carboxylase] ligase
VGILLESRPSEPEGGVAVVIGIGINLATHPTAMVRDAADLDLSGDRQAVDSAFRLLAARCERWIDIFDGGKGFPAIRAAWLDRAFALYEPISVDLNGRTIRGKFAGLAESGALEIETAPGNVITIIAGDVASGDYF